MSDRSVRTEEMAIDLSALWRALWRARFWLVPVVALVAVGAYLALSSLPPKYRAEAKILIEARGSRIDAGQKDPEAERTLLDQEGVTSQVQLVASRDLARRVVEREKLGDLAEFRKAPGLIQSLLPFLARGGTVSPEQQVLDAYFERLTVYAIEKSRVIAIEFVAGDPDIAARVANALVREYLVLQAEAKVTTSTDASDWLEGEITGLRAKVAEAEAKVEQWRTSHDLFATNRDGTLVEQQLSGLNTQLSTARAEKAALEARAEQLRKLITSGDLDASADLQTSAALQRLRERETLLRSRLAELSATLLSGHPQIRALNAQVADIQAQQRIEARRVLAALETEVRVADQRLGDLRAEFGDGKVSAAKANESDIQLRALEREAKAQRDLLETFLARYREAIARQSDRALPPDARAISQASPPTTAYFPKVVPLTVLVTFAVFLMLTAYIILRELVSGRALRPADGYPITATPAASVPVAVAPKSAEPSTVAPAAVEPTDPDDPGPGGRRRKPRDSFARAEPAPALVATAERGPAAGVAAHAGAAPTMVLPDDIAWVDGVDDGFGRHAATPIPPRPAAPPVFAAVEPAPTPAALAAAEPAFAATPPVMAEPDAALTRDVAEPPPPVETLLIAAEPPTHDVAAAAAEPLPAAEPILVAADMAATASFPVPAGVPFGPRVATFLAELEPPDAAPDVAAPSDADGAAAPAADVAIAAEAVPPAATAPSPGLLAALDDAFAANCAVLALVTPAMAEHARAAALVAARHAAERGRACLVEWGQHATPLGDWPGLTDLLHGHATFEDIIGVDPVSGAHLVPVGSGGLALDAPALALVMDAIGSCYDTVIVDAGIAAGDMDALAGLQERLRGVDAVIIVAGPHEAPLAELLRLTLANAGLANVIVAENAAPEVAAPEAVTAAESAA